MKISTKLWAGFLGMVLLTAMGTGIGWVLAGQTSTDTKRMVEVDVTEQAAAQSAHAYIVAAGDAGKAFLLTPDLGHVARVDGYIEKAETSLQNIERISANEGRRQAAAQALQKIDAYRSLFREVVDLRTQRGLTHKEGLEGNLRKSVHAIEEKIEKQGLAELTVLLLMSRRHEKDFLLRGDEKYLAKIAQRIEEFSEQMEEFGIPSDEQTEIRGLWQNYYSGMASIVEIGKKIDAEKQQFNQIYDELVLSTVAISEAASQNIAEAEEELAHKLAQAQSLLAGVLVVAVLIGLFVAVFTSRSITRPLAAIVHRISEIQESNDLTQRINAGSKDEIGDLANRFDTFVETLHDVIVDVNAAAREVASAAAEITTSSRETTHGMEQQNQQVFQISSAIEQMSSSVIEVARKSGEAANNASESGKVAQEGSEVVNQTIEGMQVIRDTVSAGAASVMELGKRGEQIGQIIDVINDIADQTNLLALNAAIEAARAGEHGRGFAVVADEVRKLADRTTKATDEIGQSIQAIQKETGEAVQRMNAGTEHVTVGVKRTTEAGQSLQKIVANAQDVAGMIQSIAAAAEQQSAASEEVSRNVQAVSEVTRQSTESVSQAAAAASQLSGKAEQLQTLVGRFKTKMSAS